MPWPDPYFGSMADPAPPWYAIALEELGETPVVLDVVGVVALTVLLSVLLHGASAGPLVARYAREEATASPDPSSG